MVFSPEEAQACAPSGLVLVLLFHRASPYAIALRLSAFIKIYY
jgi:hypothetical protein